MAAVAVQAHGRIGDFGGVVLDVGVPVCPGLVPAGTTTPVENGWNSVPAGAETLVDVLAAIEAVQRQQMPALSNAPITLLPCVNGYWRFELPWMPWIMRLNE